MERQHQRRNHLYRLRRSRGLGQKQLALLLGYRGHAMISRLERGVSLPSLAEAMLLEMAIGARVQDIYVDLQQTLERLILKRAANLPVHLRRHILGRLRGEDDLDDRHT
jgi:transcriptional regulator with XRE-family HTH domain